MERLYPGRDLKSDAGLLRKHGTSSIQYGRGAVLTDPQSLGNAEFLIAADLDDSDREARIRLAAPISRAERRARV